MDFVCEAFADDHDPSAFDSGQPRLDDWLRNAARGSDGRNLTRTYVWHRHDRIVVAYYILMPFIIERDTLARRQGRGLPDRLPGYLLARLALDRQLHKQRLGSQLLASALERAGIASRDIGGRSVIVDAIDEAAHAFYRHHGFDPVPGTTDRLILATKSLHRYLP